MQNFDVVFLFQVYESVSVTLVPDTKTVDLEWASNPVHDMVVDSVIALMLSIESKGTTGMAKGMISFLDTVS